MNCGSNKRHSLSYGYYRQAHYNTEKMQAAAAVCAQMCQQETRVVTASSRLHHLSPSNPLVLHNTKNADFPSKCVYYYTTLVMISHPRNKYSFFANYY